MFTIGHNQRTRAVQERFQYSGETISCHFNNVLNAIVALSLDYFLPLGSCTPQEVLNDPRFHPYFKDCVGVVDGVHIPVMVGVDEQGPFRNRKGIFSQNVMAACSFDLQFQYVLAGWEGSATDSGVLSAALTRRNKLHVPEGKYYLVDSEYANMPGFIPPYSSIHGQLSEYTGDHHAQNVEELFNHRHSLLRNAINRTFEVSVMLRHTSLSSIASLTRVYDIVQLYAHTHFLSVKYVEYAVEVVIGPTTVGGIQAGAFKIGDTAGTIDNIIQCKLYRPGCVGFVSKSGGMSNELYNTIARITDGIYEGIAIGGDVFPGSTLSDHVLRFNNIPLIKMIVVLGELGGRDEYSLAEALKQGKVNKPVVAWVSGTCARLFKSEVQFGHTVQKVAVRWSLHKQRIKL